MDKYTVIQDSREQQGWSFTPTDSCTGMIVQTLPTGDYTLLGYETQFIIERKASTGEFSRNIVEHRFEQELKRMEAFPYPFMVLEFTFDDILAFPKNSGIPIKCWPQLRISPYFLLKRLLEFEFLYKTKVILAGTHGKDIASSLFKRFIEIQHATTRTKPRKSRKASKNGIPGHSGSVS